MTKPNKTQPPTPTPTTGTADETAVEELSEYRVLISDTSDPVNPQVVPLVIVAASDEAAKAFVGKMPDPFRDALPQGSYRGRCRLEEVLPFAREGFAIRRDKWNITEVALVHPGIGTRFDIYMRNPDQPHHRPTHIRELSKFEGQDLLTEDWSVGARPPNFGGRR